MFSDEVLGKRLEGDFVMFRAIYQEEAGKAVFDRFKVRGTPTTMIVNVQGEEVERVVGYDGEGEAFVKNLEGLSKSEDSYLVLLKKLAKKPDDLRTAALLMEKYVVRRNYENAGKMRDMVLSKENEAKKLTIPVYGGKYEVSAYEAAKYEETFEKAGKVLSFCREFPESKLKEEAFRNLRRFMYKKETSEEALAVYEELLVKYGNNIELTQSYVGYCASAKTNVDKGLKLAAGIYQVEKAGDLLAQNYAKLYLIQGDKNNAAEVYGENFADLYGKAGDADGLNGYAWFWAVEGENLASALKAALKSIELKDDANTWDTLSMVYWKQGKLEEAVQAEEKALQMVGGKNEDFAKRIEEIKKEMEKGKL